MKTIAYVSVNFYFGPISAATENAVGPTVTEQRRLSRGFLQQTPPVFSFTFHQP